MTKAARQPCRERRWIILGEDGRYVTLGRASDPTELEIADAEKALQTQSLSGWLAVMQGNPFIGPQPRLLEVRALGKPARAFDTASASCIAAILERRTRLGQ
jgi:hypothetical protein